jgi:hypothetical protein
MSTQIPMPLYTITDNPQYQIQLFNESRFNELEPNEKELFILLRNSLLEFFPTTNPQNSQHNEQCVRYAENFAFINLTAFLKFNEKYIDEKIQTLEESIMEQIQQIQSSLQQ